MRVGSVPLGGHVMSCDKWPKFGEILCVEDFFEWPRFNAVMFVGFGGWREYNGLKCGWRASCFRKVEEIKLCVEATKRTLKPKEAADHATA